MLATAKRLGIIMLRIYSAVTLFKGGGHEGFNYQEYSRRSLQNNRPYCRRNRRSIQQQQVLTILDRARILDNESQVEQTMEIRKRLEGRELGNTIDELHEERNR